MTRKLTYAMLALMGGSIPSLAQVNTGTFEPPQTDFNSSQLISQSFMGTIGGRPEGVLNAPSSTVYYWNTVNIRHRNGSGDGSSYGGQLAFGMTSMTDRMFFRAHNNGTWTGWKEAYTSATPRVLINNAVDDGTSALNVNGSVRTSVISAVREGSAEQSTQFHLRNTTGSRAFNLQLTEGEYPGMSMWSFNGAWHEAMRITATGDVAIGTTDPKGYKLAVAGTMIAEKVKVKLAGAWPDYVFDKTYALPGLDSVETYIRDHKRLPGVASAEELHNNGLDVAEMQRVQMQKLEELTLYIIELNKKIREQEAEIYKLKKERQR